MRQIKLRIGISILVGLDMLSKYIFYNFKYLNETVLIRPVLNKGISRSLPVPLMIIIGVSIVGIAAFIWLFTKKQIGRGITALLIAGTAGNLIDRFIY
jgi:lipoprotein signal peptidase